MANGLPISLTPQFQRFGLPAQAPPQPQQQSGGLSFNLNNPLSQALGAAGRGLIEGGSRGGLGMALLGATSAGIPAFAQAQQFQQQQAQEQAAAQAAAQQQALENLLAQAEADRKAAADARGVLESDRGFAFDQQKEQRLEQSAAAQQAIAKGNLAVGQGNLALRGQELERGFKPDFQVQTVRLPNGEVRSFRRDDPALDQALQRGAVGFNAQVQAPDLAGLGGATTSTQTRAQETLDSAADTLGVINQFRETLRPENIGLSGDIRELGIGALGQAESFRAWGDSQTQGIIDQAISSGDTLDLSRFAVDPALSSQRLLENILAYRLAKIQDPSGRISDADFRNAQLSLGTGKKLTSIGDLLARVDAFEQTVQRTQGIAQQRLGIAPGQQAAPAGGGQAPTVIRFDAQGNIIQ